MAVTIEDVRALSPQGEFDSVPDCFIEDAIEDAEASHDVDSCLGDLRDMALKNFAAHTLAMRLGGTNSVAGPVTSQSAGGIAQSFGAATSSVSTGAGYFQKTVWGQEYWRILQNQTCTPLVGCSAGAVFFNC